MNPKSRLSEIKIEVTYQCSLACVHCSSDAVPSSTLEISKPDCLRIIAEAHQLGATHIVLSGGEPLLWSPLEDVVSAAVANAMEVVLYSSGNAPRAEEILRRLARTGLASCIFSIFASTDEKHENITRVRGSFQSTRRAIDAAREIGLPVELHFVPMANNYTELKAIALLAREWKVARISVLRFVPHGRGALLRHRVLNRLQNINLRNSILSLRQQGFEIRTGSPYNFLLLNERPQCLAGRDRLVVGPDLRIYPCDAFKQVRAEDIVGSLELSSLNGYSLTECWTSSPFLTAVRRYLSEANSEPCLSCRVADTCLSGCLAQKVIAYGALIKGPDPSCLYTKKESTS